MNEISPLTQWFLDNEKPPTDRPSAPLPVQASQEALQLGTDHRDGLGYEDLEEHDILALLDEIESKPVVGPLPDKVRAWLDACENLVAHDNPPLAALADAIGAQNLRLDALQQLEVIEYAQQLEQSDRVATLTRVMGENLELREKLANTKSKLKRLFRLLKKVL